MLFGLDAAALVSKGIVLAGLAACGGAPKKIDVDVQFKHVEAPYVTDMTSEEMTATFKMDPDSTMATEAGLWTLGGMNRAQFSWHYSVDYQHYQEKKTGAYCYAQGKITFFLTYTNTIYIAADARLKGCRYSVTKAHEKRHVSTDLRVTKDWIPDIRAAMARGAKDIRYIPFEKEKAQENLDAFLRPVEAQVNPVMDQMRADRRKKQAAIDTHDMYMRDTALCPGQ